MPAILRSVYKYNTPKSPKEAMPFFPREEQLRYMRQLMKTGLKQHWVSYDSSSRKIIKAGLTQMDKFLEKTGHAIEPKFISIVQEA